MDQAAGESPWTRFSQSEDLTVRLRNILHDYAFGPGVFRELLQNADDARATRFAILADGASYTAEGNGLLDPRLGAWQGPAVCAFNDAEFTDADFTGICRVGASGKRSDHAKIGRYGLGFNASYHLTDVVSFVSRDRLCIFDPHEAHLPEGLPGLQLRLPPSESGRNEYAAQLEPFEAAIEAFGAKAWPLQGALFRLPLRTSDLAARSQICRESRDFDEVVGVLQELLRGAQELLLFLQSVESFEVLIRAPGSRQIQRLGAASMRTANEFTAERLRAERRLLSGAVPSDGRKQSVRRGCFTFLVDVTSPDSGNHTSAWMVATRTEPLAEELLDGSEAGEELPHSLCGAVALRLWPLAASSGCTPLAGQAFCFLPLALSTGLPVHISANFALTANRRDLWRRSDDKASSHSMRRAAWNEALLEGTLPRTYAETLEILAAGLPQALEQQSEKARCCAGFEACNLLPSDGPWMETLSGVYPPIELWAAWPSDAAHGTFQPIAHNTVSEIFRRDAAVLWNEAEVRYMSGKSALLCACDAFAAFDTALQAAFSKLGGARNRRSIVEVPQRLCSVLDEVKGASWLRPQSFATVLRNTAPNLEAHEADAVVKYLLMGGSGPLTVLHGLLLCPLAAGGLGRFEKPGAHCTEDLWWADDESFCKILPGRKFVDPSSGTFELLKPRIHNAPLNIRCLNGKSLPYVLPALVPPSWRGKRVVCVEDRVVYVDGQTAHTVHQTLAPKTAASAATSGQRGGQHANTRASGSKAPGGVGQKKTGKKGQKPRVTSNRSKSTWDVDDWGDCAWEWNEADWEHNEYKDEEEAGEITVEGPSELAPKEHPVEEACVCYTVDDLHQVVHRCRLLWSLIESSSMKGLNPEQLLYDLPCIPLEESQGAVPQALFLLSIQEAMKRHVLAVEDFSSNDRAVLEVCGVPFVRPGKRMRGVLGIEKTSMLSALQAVFARRPDTTVDRAAPANPRLFMGLKPIRVPLDEARPLRVLLSNLLAKNIIKDIRAVEALPIFETQGGQFAVPLVPNSARIMSPNEDWDEALLPHFADYLISWAGEAGVFLKQIGRETSSSTAQFLSEFVAPRAGLFDESLCVRFLEAVAALGNAPWKKSGAPKDLAAVAQACIDAPLVVFPSASPGAAPARFRCSELADPGDAALGTLSFVSTCFPPEAYCGPLALSVMRKAGLRSLTDEDAFLDAARAAEVSAHPVQSGTALLRHLGERYQSLKWSSKAYTALGRLSIFPVFSSSSTSSSYPPVGEQVTSTPTAVALNGPCTLFRNAEVAWTQLSLLAPDVFDRWPTALFQRFGALKDPVPLEVLTANLSAAAAKWASESATDALQHAQRRQDIVGKHLSALRCLSKRSHATQIMVQQQLCCLAFLVMDDGTLSKPSDVFVQLHSGGDSDKEEEFAEDSNAATTPKEKKREKCSGPWQLPAYLRPFRRLLLSLSGPAVSAGNKTIPSIHVCASPKPETVPKFLQDSLNDPALADVEFMISHDDKQRSVFAHRLILAAACEHFHSSFTMGFAEAVGVGGRCRVELPDWVMLQPLLWLLAYLYQGFDPLSAKSVADRMVAQMESPSAERTSVTRADPRSKRRLPRLFPEDADAGEHLCCLLRLADLYGVTHLKQWTEQRLQSLLNPENLVALSTHAFFCNASQLLALCVYHMQQLYGELAHTEEWKNLEPAIRDLVLTDVSNKPTVAAEA